MNETQDAARKAAEYINKLGEELGDIGYAQTIWRAARTYIAHTGPGRPPEPPGESMMAKSWRCRLMISDPRGDVVADSMEGESLEVPPDQPMPTLPALARWAAEAVNQYHSERGDPQPVGLDADTLRKAILALRVNLTRTGGECWWRVPYTVGGESWRVMARVHRVGEGV